MSTVTATRTVYHLFADHTDDWYDDYELARKEFEAMKADGYPNIRLYEEIWPAEDQGDDEPLDENCILAVGDYPL